MTDNTTPVWETLPYENRPPTSPSQILIGLRDADPLLCELYYQHRTEWDKIFGLLGVAILIPSSEPTKWTSSGEMRVRFIKMDRDPPEIRQLAAEIKARQEAAEKANTSSFREEAQQRLRQRGYPTSHPRPHKR